jgi:hypothetical protein
MHAITALSRTADMSLQAKEEELRFLRLEVAENLRIVCMLRERFPEKALVENELTTAQVCLSQIDFYFVCMFILGLTQTNERLAGTLTHCRWSC